jgi:hypothetical protein
MGPLDKDVVRPDALKATGDGLTLDVHQHWYRSLPLSSVGVLDVQIDDEPVDLAEVPIEANGKRYSFAELAELPDVDLGLLIPYLLIGPPDQRKPLLASSLSDKTVTCN